MLTDTRNRKHHNTQEALRNFAEQGYQVTSAPPCMSADDWDSYQLSAIRVKSNTSKFKGEVNPCMDCCAKHADKMRAVSKCLKGRVAA